MGTVPLDDGADSVVFIVESVGDGGARWQVVSLNP